MPRKNPPTGTAADLNLHTLSELFVDENKARDFFEQNRWPNGPICPHCESKEVYRLTAKEGSKHPAPRGTYKCAKCRQKFTARIGTILEDSKIPYCKFIMAVHLMTSSKKGISSHQMARELGITQKSAWFLNHRIREAMKKEPMAGMLHGVVEVDETYVGGKPRSGWKRPPKPKLGPTDSKFAAPARNPKGGRGRGTKKAPVMVLVERGGGVRCAPVHRVTAKELGQQIEVNVAKDALLITDDFRSYTSVGRRHPGGHEVIRHADGEYARTRDDGLRVHTNTAESFFALLKRGHYGIFHQLSKKHLHRYCTEFGFRWSLRKVKDGERMVEAIKGVEGKRLMYRQPIHGLIG
jgi:transposase-like protein